MRRSFIVSLLLLMFVFSITNVYAQRKAFQYYKHNGQVELLGRLDREDLIQKVGFWIDSLYDKYDPDVYQLKSYHRAYRDIKIEIYLGTWSEESRYQLPCFIKVLDEMGFPKGNVTFFAVDNRQGAFHQGLDNKLPDTKIFKVPTIVINYNGEELDRIIERPVSSLEEDLIGILDGARNYLPRFPLTYILSKHIESVGLETIKLQEDCMMNTYIELSESRDALLSLARLYADDKKDDEANYIYLLNTKLYPSYSGSWYEAGKFYMDQERYAEARLCFENLLKFENLKSMEEVEAYLQHIKEKEGEGDDKR